MTNKIANWEWLSLNQDRWIYWQTAHTYYIPQGLFKSLRNGPINIDDYDDWAGDNFCSSPYLLRKNVLKNTNYKKIVCRLRKKYTADRKI